MTPRRRNKTAVALTRDRRLAAAPGILRRIAARPASATPKIAMLAGSGNCGTTPYVTVNPGTNPGWPVSGSYVNVIGPSAALSSTVNVLS
jgi:hypothetical protein